MDPKKISIFKNDDDIVIEEIDIDDPKIQEEIKEIQREQERILDRKNIESGSLELVVQL
jgi:hypothetical protein